jgi:hypothetical protein
VRSAADGFFFMEAWWSGTKRKKAGGYWDLALRGGENGLERERALGVVGDNSGGRRVRAARLPRDMGGRWGRATSGPVGSGWMREGALASGQRDAGC